ncbi:Uncharacterized protein DBV15_08507 [Temnothorax longispinosus]|uniref:Uncharacterized protein n=2 Tax=Temnothorax longispinosus TaxID=300112 RepID=A0A4S2K3K4_9HYME|nr:Uncharacterized protein DBV15_08507 [Temnothorax longispinosus]
MSKFFRELLFCGCSSRSGHDSRSIVVDESIVDDPPPKFAEPLNHVAAPEGVARHFDLSTIKFIDDEEADEDAACTKNEELDGPKAGRIRDAWIIAVERSARERLQKYTALKKIQPRDIQAILHQRINDAVASTSEDSTSKDVSNGQITVTLADKELGTNAFSTKLSNGTIPKGLGKEADIRVEDTSQERKDALEKQQSCEEANLLLPVQSGRIGERRSSSPFQNGRTEVLIGEPEGGPRSPRGSTSSAVNDGNFLNPLDERDEPICR